MSDLYVGATVTVYSRRLTVTGFADEKTSRAIREKREEAFVMVLGRDASRVGRCVAAMQGAGMTIVDVRTVRFESSRAEELETALPRSARALLAGTACAIRAHGREANAELERLFGDTDIVRSLDEEHARALNELATSSRAARTNSERSTLVLVKPSGMAHLGAILDVLIEKRGLELVQARTMALTRAEAESFYAVYVDVLDKEEVRLMVEELSSGTCVALQLTRFDSPETLVDDVREFVGPRDPEIARTIRPESLRARFGEDKQRNAVHCVDLPEDGPLEVDFFFNLSHRHTIAA